MTTSARDLRYGRRGGGWADSNGSTLDGPPCDVCGQPMLVGQKRRHAVCSPPCDLCGHPIDLIPDLSKHLEAHA